MTNEKRYRLTHQRGWFCPHGVEFFVSEKRLEREPDWEPCAPYAPAEVSTEHYCGMPIKRRVSAEAKKGNGQ